MTVSPPPESSAPLSPAQAAAALRWLIDSGADVLAGAAAGSWLEPPVRLKAPRRAAPPPAPRQAAPRPAGPSAAPPPAVSAAALTARTLDELRAEAETLPFAIRRDGAPLVFADGNPAARVMVIGEAPGAEEERQGKPFVGPAGQLLDRMLGAIDLDRSHVYITNLSPWRPGANRTPNTAEAAQLLPLLHRHIALVQPEFLLLVGGTSAKALLGTPSGIMRLRGRWQDVEVEGARYPALPTFHPAYLLREPAQKRLAWQDLLTLRARLD